MAVTVGRLLRYQHVTPNKVLSLDVTFQDEARRFILVEDLAQCIQPLYRLDWYSLNDSSTSPIDSKTTPQGTRTDRRDHR